MITNIKDTPYFALYLSKVRQDCIEHPEKYYKGNVTVSCNGLSKREDNK